MQVRLQPTQWLQRMTVTFSNVSNITWHALAFEIAKSNPFSVALCHVLASLLFPGTYFDGGSAATVRKCCATYGGGGGGAQGHPRALMSPHVTRWEAGHENPLLYQFHIG